MNLPKIYLASGSPRRSELLTQIGVSFERLSLEVNETRLDNELPLDYVQRIALSKAQAGWQSLGKLEHRPVIGADTSVVIDEMVLGKPENSVQAEVMLRQLSGRQHTVLTAVSVVYNEQALTKVSGSTVTFATMTEADIAWYIDTGEGEDKAGSYAVQGLAAVFIEKIEGSYSGIMGLPLRETMALLTTIGSTCHEQ